MTMFKIAFGVLCLAACAKSDAPPPAAATAVAAAPVVADAAGQGCQATGQWAECSLVYHLNRAGLAARTDSGAVPQEKELGGQPVMLKIGQIATLELHIYPDSAARIADAAKLNRADFVSGAAPQTMKRERTLIQSVNVIGLLTSINDHQRERVSDAITAGPPQPAKAARIANPPKP
jgi:hypothetical protein